MAIELAAGAAKLGETLWTPAGQKVLYVNGEDSKIEITRRLCGFCQRHKLTEQDVDRLYVVAADDPRVQSISFLQVSDKNATLLNESGVQRPGGRLCNRYVPIYWYLIRSLLLRRREHER